MNWLRYLPVLVLCVLAGVAIIVALDYRGEPVGWIALGFASIWIGAYVISYYGMSVRRKGSRFQFVTTTYQPLDHPLARMDPEEGATEWREMVGLSGVTLESAWYCKDKGCHLKRFMFRGLDGSLGMVHKGNIRQPWGKWSAGLFVAYAKDPPRDFVDPD